ncbi:MAG: FeoC-like transcriptional regulator [Sulfolobales archaeon]|nr:FeoC-like transcriptional regulator [Sulfolobales archaeon]
MNDVVVYLKNKGCVTVDDLIKDFSLSPSEVNVLLGVLIAEGIVEEVEALSNCKSCSLSALCGHHKRGRSFKMLKLRESKKLMK